MQNSDAWRREKADLHLTVIARSEATKQSILPSLLNGLLRFARNSGIGCLKFKSEIRAADGLPLPRALVQHLQHQFHGHQYRVVAAHQPALGEAAEIIDQRDIECGFQRAGSA
jgi:hypothetical protein